tara:strand:- start:2667 stop:2873 length:207 start_codon:yes stop_codon:yes gene_type:complete
LTQLPLRAALAVQLTLLLVKVEVLVLVVVDALLMLAAREMSHQLLQAKVTTVVQALLTVLGVVVAQEL